MTPEVSDTASHLPAFSKVQADAMVLAEHRANVDRLHYIAKVGGAVWSVLFASDVVLATWVEPGPIAVYGVVRALGIPMILAVHHLTRPGTSLTPGALRLLEGTMFLWLSAGVAVMTLAGNGLTGVYAAGISGLTVARGVSIAQPWRDAVPVNAAMIGMHPMILAAAAPFVPSVSAQWRDPLAVGHLGVALALLAAIALLSILGAHAQWALRREVLEARSVGRYAIVGHLGSGGMGDVWRARVRGTHQEVALKVLKSVDPLAVGRFEREVAALSALHHPHTVRVFDYGVTEAGVPYFAMELLFGQDLDALLQDGPLPWPRAVEIVRQAASALGEAHQKGIVHRDVKPNNLMLVDGTHGRDHVKVLDFGIARAADAHTQMTAAARILGTPAWMSPEAARGLPVDARADVYALGAVLFALITGRPPFEGDASSLLHQHRSAPTPSLESAGVVGVPPWVEHVVQRAMAKSPDQRYPDGAALAAELAPAQETPTPLAARRTGPPPPVSADTIGFGTPAPAPRREG